MDLRSVLAPGRRRSVAAALAVVVAVLSVLTVTVVQVRAHVAEEARVARQAEEARAAAEQERRDAEVARAEREAAQREAAQREAAEREAAERAEAWAVAAQAAEAEHGAGVALLAQTEGAVADDAVRTGLAAALEALRGLLDGGLTPDDDGAVAAVQQGVGAVQDAARTVTEAHTAWAAARAEEERVAAAARAAQDAAAERAAGGSAAAERPGTAAGGDPGAGPRPPTSGAGPDCGSPVIREAPTQPVAFMTSTPSEAGDGSNGRVPRSRMAALPWCVDADGNAQWLRADAAAAMIRLNDAFRARFGENIAIDMSYRSYEQQVAMREYYGSVAARPGTSNHGWGTAVDTWEWQAYAFGSERYAWLVANGPTYGWVAPGWARQGGSNPEYWHFEYVG